MSWKWKYIDSCFIIKLDECLTFCHRLRFVNSVQGCWALHKEKNPMEHLFCSKNMQRKWILWRHDAVFAKEFSGAFLTWESSFEVLLLNYLSCIASIVYMIWKHLLFLIRRKPWDIALPVCIFFSFKVPIQVFVIYALDCNTVFVRLVLFNN